MEWWKDKVNKFENVNYFASLFKNGCHFTVVHVHNLRGGYEFNHLREKPEDIKLTVASMDRDMRNGMWCSLMICQNQEEYDRYMADKEWMAVEDLWVENEQIIRTTNTIAQMEVKR